jgi:hypothetical protein
MGYLFKKYEFPSEEDAQALIDALPHSEDEDGRSHPSHNHTIVKLGHIIVEQGEWDNETQEEISAPVFAENYSVDVLWQDIDQAPEDWDAHEISLSDNGVHTFFGISYV